MSEELPELSPNVFTKASNKWLNGKGLNFFSFSKNTATLSQDQIRAGKQQQAFENYLALVCMMYYGDPYSNLSRKSKDDQPNITRPRRFRGLGDLDTLSILVSPLRADLPFEKWTPKEIAVFECSLCKYGKKFKLIQKLLGMSKSHLEITEFYYLWKTSSHYASWKEALLKATKPS
mmetsp:Transcript_22729/g.40885  ORF Transcript_22729/g.40885 Transcript_22729/m.40885 type:complete len:176 (-) Transcript_22729:1710-2237(-)